MSEARNVLHESTPSNGQPTFAEGRWWLYFYDDSGRLAYRASAAAPAGGWNWRPQS